MTLNVLVVDRAPPLNLMEGNELIGYHVFRRLRHHRLTIVCAAPAGRAADARTRLAESFDEVHVVERHRRIAALTGSVEPHVARLGFRVSTPWLDTAGSADLREAVERVAQTASHDVVHIRQLPMAPYRPRIGTGTLLELVDSETLATRRHGGFRAGMRHIMARHLERRALSRFDVTTTVSPADAAELRDLTTRARIEVVSNGVDTDQFRPLELPDDPDTIAFLGAMSFPPNVAAVRWFCADVLPRIRAARPTARFVIIGRDPVPEVRVLAADPAVHVTGLVDDVRPFLAGAAVVVAPMVSGSGLKNKVLEAMSLARPVVSTTMGVESLRVADGDAVVVADGAAAFADAVCRLLADPAERRRLGSRARSLVETTYSWDACAARYDELYEELAVLTRRRRNGTTEEGCHGR